MAPAIMAMKGTLAPQGMKVVVMMVMRRSRSFSMVREAMMPGTPQPVPISMGMKDLAGQAELAEDTVQDEGDTSHVAAGLQEGQQQEQNQHLRHEAQDSAHAGHDTVQNQAVEPSRLRWQPPGRCR